MENTNKEILGALDDDLKALKEEIKEKKLEIKEKEEEIEELEDYEMSDDDLDDMLDSCYDEVEVMGEKYPMSEVLKSVDEGRYEDCRDDETNNYIEEKRSEFEDELEELNEELEQLEDDYEEEFNDE